jgi:heat-inducible transcriptional repressor
MASERQEPDKTPEEALTERERGVLEAVVRTYVTTAEPAGSRTVAKGFSLGVSSATVRNTMSDLEEKGYLTHPHASAGRVPTDRAYRYFVDRLIRPAALSAVERDLVEQELGVATGSGIEALVRHATRALSLLTRELGVAVAPSLEDAILEKLELVQASSKKVLMIATIRSGLVRTVYVDLDSEVPQDTLVTLTLILNERLAGLTLKEIRESLPERLRDSIADDDAAEALLNIFMQSRGELFEWPITGDVGVHLGQASVLADQPEFTSGERLKSLIELTERRDLFADVLGQRQHGGGLRITIGGENVQELTDFTLVTSEYRLGNLKGVIGVIGPTRMPYEKVIAIVDYTSALFNRILRT